MATLNKIKLISDSTTSLTPEEFKERDIDYLETSYMLDNVLYSAFDNQSETLEEFYARLDNVKSCSTGCVNIQTFEECFDKYASKGIQVFYTGLSSSLSSTFSNSEIAAKNINEKYGKKLVAVVDSRSASYGTLVLLDFAQKLISEGKSLEELESEIDKIAKNMSVAFVARDLSFMYKSGRISMLEAGLGKILKIVPIVYVSESGKLKVGDKCIGRKLTFKTLKNRFVNFIQTKGHTKCYITSCGLTEDVEELKNYILENTSIKDVKTGLIDKTLACCCGPKTIAIFCG